jgi:hypothetical protein
MSSTAKAFVYQHGRKNPTFTVASKPLPMGEPQAMVASNGDVEKAASDYIHKRQPKAQIRFV